MGEVLGTFSIMLIGAHCTLMSWSAAADMAMEIQTHDLILWLVLGLQTYVIVL